MLSILKNIRNRYFIIEKRAMVVPQNNQEIVEYCRIGCASHLKMNGLYCLFTASFIDMSEIFNIGCNSEPLNYEDEQYEGVEKGLIVGQGYRIYAWDPLTEDGYWIAFVESLTCAEQLVKDLTLVAFLREIKLRIYSYLFGRFRPVKSLNKFI